MGKSIKLKNDTYIDLTSILFPVGSIYMTTDSDFNPNNQWHGTWEKIEGRMIVGANSTYPTTTTGGEATHTLTVNEIPSHTHKAGVDTQHVGNLSSSPKNSCYVYADPSRGIDTTATGGGQAHNNMPPYYSAYIWHRIA